MKLSVLGARVYSSGQAAQQLVVEITAGEIRGKLRGIDANDAGPETALQHF